jgi:hypothetical protein
MPFYFASIIIIFLLAFVFYLLIPGLGAVTTLGKWRNFRKKLLGISMYPIADYEHLSHERSGVLGTFRFFGRIESIHGQNKIWIRNESISVEADLTDVTLYFLPSQASENGNAEHSGEILEKSMPVSAKWKRISSLPEGTNVFIGGTLESEDGHGIFKSQAKDPLLVVIYDGDERTILKRAIWCGRQKNEYWNQFTLMSLITGFFSMLIYSYFLLRNPALRLPALLSLNVSLLPIALFMPPGVILYFLYRFFWKRSRILRGERDMLRLPLRYFENKRLPQDHWKATAILPDSRTYIMAKKLSAEENGFFIDRTRYVQSCSIRMKNRRRDDPSFVFGMIESEDGKDRIKLPLDPMTDFVEIAGDPEALAEKCHARAWGFVVAAVFCVITDVALNFVITFLITRYFFK